MGMFDTVRSSYDLGPGYNNKELQTKDLDCCMNDYWIDPAGQLFEIDYSSTADFVELAEGDDGYNSDRKYLNFKWIPNGLHGKIKPVYIFKIIEVYPAVFDGHYSKWPSCHILFKNGIINEIRHTNLYDEVPSHL